MATYYLPSENGWGEDHGYPYSLRLKIEQSYDAGSNKSTLTVTPQFKGGANGVSHVPVNGAWLKAGDETLISISEPVPYEFYVQNSGWTSLRTRSAGQTVSASTTLQHQADGTASLSFEMSGQTTSAAATCSFFGKSATLSLQESRTYTLTISAGTGSSITVKKGSTTLANGATITHGDVLTVSFAAVAGYDLATHTVNGSSFTSGGTLTVAGAVTVAATAARKTYTLTISAGTGSSITVKKGGTTLANGATVTHGDVLTVSFGAQTGYQLVTHTVNGSSFASGNTHTVSGAVTVAATAARNTYALTISAGTGSSITVMRNGAALSNGATITHGDVLKISFAAKDGYTLSTHTVNGSSFTSGGTHTVGGAVTVAATAARKRSTIASCSSQAETLGSIELVMNRSGSNYHKATVKKGTSVLTTSAAFASQLSISIPRSWFSGVPSATSFTVTVSVQSYTTSACTTAIGEAVTANVTIKADSGMKPVLASGYATAAPYNTGGASGINKFISGVSKAEISLDNSKLDMSAAVGASVSSISVEGGGVKDTSAPYRTGVLRDTATVKVTVTDTRGRKATQTLTVACLPYSPPILSEISAIRCDSSGADLEGGAYYAVKTSAAISSLEGANSLTLKANGYTLQNGTTRILGGSLNENQSLTVTIVAEDSLGNKATAVRTLPGLKWAMKFRDDGNGVGFGKAPEHNAALEIPEGWNVYMGSFAVWAKRVNLGPGQSVSVTLPSYRQLIISPSFGPTWIVQTAAADASPTVQVLFATAANSALSITAGQNGTVILSNSSASAYYNFFIKTI